MEIAAKQGCVTARKQQTENTILTRVLPNISHDVDMFGLVAFTNDSV
jgi:hypothetical protein